MFHKILETNYLEGTTIELTFQDGKVIVYNMAKLFDKYPRLKALTNRDLFLSGKTTAYGIRWNDELDIEAETIYQEGDYIRTKKLPANITMAYAVNFARTKAGMSQFQLAEKTGIDQADISKIENGVANPSLSTLSRIAEALGKELQISFK